MILRDVDLSTAWNAQADALDTRHYYCQNWRADVSVIIDDSAVLIERLMYSPYGVPFGIPVGDLVTIATSAEPADGLVNSTDWTELTTTYWGSSYNIADLDNDGDVDSADETIQTNNNGATLGWGALSDVHNRLGYAGYVFDEALAGTKWHVRHRVLESVLGRWVSRDPLEYVPSYNLMEMARSNPIARRDSSGLACARTSIASLAHADRSASRHVALGLPIASCNDDDDDPLNPCGHSPCEYGYLACSASWKNIESDCGGGLVIFGVIAARLAEECGCDCAFGRPDIPFDCPPGCWCKPDGGGYSHPLPAQKFECQIVIQFPNGNSCTVTADTTLSLSYEMTTGTCERVPGQGGGGGGA